MNHPTKKLFLSTGAVVAALAHFGHANPSSAAEPMTSMGTNTPVKLPTVTVSAPPVNYTPQLESSSVTSVSGEIARPGGISSPRDFMSLAPNVAAFNADNDRIPRFSVRGLRENNFATGESAVAFYVDGVPYTDLTSRGVPLFDVEQIDFLRGPQGTLFGASAPGGVINITTRQPGNQWHGRGLLSYGNYDAQNYEAGVSGPIIKDQLYFGLSGLYGQRDGYVKNKTLGTEPDDRETLAGRAQLRWTPTEAWDISLSASAERFNDGFVPTYYPQVDSNPFSVRRDFDGHMDTDQFQQALNVGFNPGPVKFSSTTSHRTWKQDLMQDFDFSPVPGVLGFSNPELEQWTQELRLQSPDSQEKISWLAGLYFMDRNLDNDSGSILPSGQPIPFPPGFIPGPLTMRTKARFDDQTYAIFGQSTVTVLEKLDVIGGLRFEYSDRSLRRDKSDDVRAAFGLGPIPTVRLDEDFTALLPKAGLVYRFTETQNVFATASAGFQSGGFNASNDNPAQAGYDPTRSWNFELGYKSSWLDERLSTRAAVFYVDYSDYQVFRFNQMDPTQAYLVNAEDAYSYGAELEIEARPTSNFDVIASFGVTEAKFDRFRDSISSGNFDDQNINFVPEFTANLAAQYRFPCNLYARAEVQGVGSYYLDEGNTARQSAYALVHAKVGYRTEHFDINLFARNIFDKEYVSNALDLRTAVTPDQLIYQPGDPMLIGIAASAQF